MRARRYVAFFGAGFAFALGPSCSLVTDMSGLAGAERLDVDAGGAFDARANAPEDAARDADGAGTPAADAADANGGMCPPRPRPAACDPDRLEDGHNCCVAGHDCQGAACVGGACQPIVVVADATGDARGISATGDALVWATGCTNRLRRVRKDGTEDITLPQGANCTPTVATYGADAYWIEWNGPNLNTTPIDGTGAVRTIATVRAAGSAPESGGAESLFARLAVDGTNAYWATTSPAAIWFAPLAATGATPTPLAADPSTFLATEPLASPYGVAVDATHVYFSDVDGGTIKRRALASLDSRGSAEVVASGESGPRDIAVDAARVYWLTGNGLVRARAKDASGAAQTLAVEQSNAESIAVDDVYVYWSTFQRDGAVQRVNKTGGATETLAAHQPFPYGLTLDCDTVYWTNHGDGAPGAVLKIAK